MRAFLVPLVLLLCHLGEAKYTPSEDGSSDSLQCGIVSDLRDLRDMVVLQRAELSHTMAELQDTKTKVEGLKTENSGKLFHFVLVMESRLMSSERQLEAMKTENAAMVSRVTSTESEIEKLQRENAERPKAAFSTSLGKTGHHGPFNTATTVIYKNIFTNTGDHYNNATGSFTAPVRGVYHFSFTMGDFLQSTVMGLSLFKNEQQIIHSGEWGDHMQFRSASNAVILQLEVGDVVFMQLPANYRIYDDSNHRNTFTGILLFPI
ncbi:complement C1q-like protein 2 isoform X1 [Coregonus clupeaformis]|uniref:complement C1q-like protein 2 isoform X1 n=1 Tax=Coregonus clupeaformis TaxID=59861 RepID=UPI001BE104CD|nr:complement C1q-like protein 2 isoform X1 [Coregonus clupeaformis]